MMQQDASQSKGGVSGQNNLPQATARQQHVDPLEYDDNDDIDTPPPQMQARQNMQPQQPQPIQLHSQYQQLPSAQRVTERSPPAPISELAKRPESSTRTLPANDLKQSSTVSFSSTSNQNETSTTNPPVKPTITVEITRDGTTRAEELDPRELARLYAQQQAALRSVRGEFDILYVPDWVRLHPLIGAYVAEAFGTFACVLTLSLVSVRNASIFDTASDVNMTSLPIGFMFMCMVFTFGYISGGHFNPAVTIAVFLVRKLDVIRTVGYIICQTGASLGAGLVAMAIQGSTNIFVPHVNTQYVSSGIFSELIFTFAIATVVLNVAYSRQSGNFFYGFAIGMTVAAGSAAVGKISGGAFNPAAATGLQLALCLTGDCEPLASFWIYWMAPLVGAVVASILYSQMYQPEDTNVLSDAAALQPNSAANGVTQEA